MIHEDRHIQNEKTIFHMIFETDISKHVYISKFFYT